MSDDGGDEASHNRSGRDESLSDHGGSRFDDLHDLLDERQNKRNNSTTNEPTPSTTRFSPTDRPESESESTEVNHPDRTRESDSLTRLKEIFAERLPESLPSEDTEPTANESNSTQLLYVGLIIGVVLAVVLPGVVLASSAHITDTILAPSPTEYVESDDTLYLNTENAAYLSRIYEETTNEVAYCGLITHDEENPILDVWMANTVNAGPDQVEFLTDNCPGEVREVLLHTHPSGSLKLSETDRETLADRPEEIMCVQGGTLETEPGAELDTLACYRQLHPDDPGLELSQIPVVITDDSPGA